ncbi:aspartyl-phosphate phosphatase Spo0E family protein [Salipaludibacillus daqingensis]|uniref:aspartyl-phosphate phosphatase Spo0E family protein n=1 Tax=Salipaludibacillus daqingensis TaxID=3041001 RepID=UPI002475286E|nr:aspartyl-phosphate phosphatase Spo0E family protein [Salipaludibacillus daqingensis]
MALQPSTATELLREIESVRNKMNELSSHKNRTSKEVIELSMYLDKLLNEYEMLYKEKQ